MTGPRKYPLKVIVASVGTEIIRSTNSSKATIGATHKGSASLASVNQTSIFATVTTPVALSSKKVVANANPKVSIILISGCKENSLLKGRLGDGAMTLQDSQSSAYALASMNSQIFICSRWRQFAQDFLH